MRAEPEAQEAEGARHRPWRVPGLPVVAVLAVLTAAMWMRPPLRAQPTRPSQHGSVSQQIADATITIEYNRPVARGRELFGALVPWGRIWCPGADDCTSITISTDIQVNRQPLKAGAYSLWAEPQPERWTVIFSKQSRVFHTSYPYGQDALRVTAVPRTGSRMETLAFYFPVVDGRHAELVLHWGTVVVPLAIDVP